jgi:hypothetical protein
MERAPSIAPAVEAAGYNDGKPRRNLVRDERQMRRGFVRIIMAGSLTRRTDASARTATSPKGFP